eukprot:gnl/TRDRNA2_/TRDRNA2_37309_c0_seq1.p2 gnl/TRDRNA2_/TRDRNA2_37309_c0~~gnl/TRDRNA2_/TRDRNA2_37309_c0_seq1.p2  ORF type:complete len:147 (+),score=52.94 gnl/TRDRNA2_/TRDRNA2_37309_c0_seq1:97-537(+)
MAMVFELQNENTSPTLDLNAQLDSSAPLKRKRQSEVDGIVLAPGDRIVVVEEFKSNQAKKRMLTVGLTGTVARTDEAKDANISFDFEDGVAKHWVLKKNFGKLKVLEDEVDVEEATVDDTVAPEAPPAAKKQRIGTWGWQICRRRA